MNGTTSGQPIPGGVDTQITAYVAGVREALADLPPEDLDDLTAGMAADLSEVVRERGGALTDHLGSPASYAAELRAAAGLPTSTGQRPAWRRVPARLGERWRRLRAEQPAVGVAADYVATLRPAWWLLRGLTVAYLLTDVFGSHPLTSPIGVVLAVLAMSLSVWLGLRPASRRRWWTVAVNVVLGVAAVAVVLAVWSALDRADRVRPEAPMTSLSSNEVLTSNFYVYDAEGRRIDAARIFTADGHPLVAVDHFMPWIGANPDTDPAPVPELQRKDTFGSVVTGVYPRRAAGVDPWAKQGNDIYGWTPPQAYPPLAPLSPAELPKPTAAPIPAPTSTPTARQPTPPAATRGPAPAR